MNVHLFSFPEDVRVLCARFDLLLMLPVEDWFALFELAEKAGQSPPTYMVGLLKNHVREARAHHQEPA